jgi:CheY-like chemotaxis protein
MDPVILVVDDNDDNRFTLSMRLETCGYGNIVTAENGLVAAPASMRNAEWPYHVSFIEIVIFSSASLLCWNRAG